MKKNIRLLISLLVILAGVTIAQVSFAQPPSPPPSGGNGGSNTPMGGAAPIDGGVVILIAAGVGYGAKKIYHARFFSKEKN
jgi:hypothetical protein